MRVANRDYLTWFLSSSEEFSRAISQSNLIPPAKLLPTGMPRNDVFFSGQQQVVAAAARRSLGLDDGTAIVLYAPTYREAGQGFASDLDLGAVARALQARFGRRFTILVRGHWWMKGLAAGLETLDVTDYPHTQDLLCAADVLLTDYSSSIWDFTFTGRPAFLYVPDLEAYEQAPGLETPIATWPYPFATTQAALLQNIADFDEAAHAAKVAQHQAAFGNYETGRATDHVCVLVEAAVSGAEAGRPGLGQQP
jgi:CDP-glycerol glycerophosphotransferase